MIATSTLFANAFFLNILPVLFACRLLLYCFSEFLACNPDLLVL